MRLRLLLVTVSLLFIAWQPASQRRDPLEYIRILESAERVRKLQVDRVIDALKVQPGQKIADLGAGSGLFTRPLARRVGSTGTIYAVDIDRDLLEHINETALEQNLPNITTVLASEFDPRIPEKVDLVLICDTLHQIKNADIYLHDLTRYLKTSARVAVIDYADNWPARFASSKYSVRDLDRWMEAAGLHRDESFDFLDDNFFIVYQFGSPASSTRIPHPQAPGKH
ncbi:MAG: class I SAM-dependent methyltransferase [Acidobacteriota bacterium]